MQLPRMTTGRLMPSRRQVSIRGLMICVAIAGTGSAGSVIAPACNNTSFMRSSEAAAKSPILNGTGLPGSGGLAPHPRLFIRAALRRLLPRGVRPLASGNPGSRCASRSPHDVYSPHTLYAPDVEFTDAELRAVSNLRGLRDLDIHQTGIDDAGLAPWRAWASSDH